MEPDFLVIEPNEKTNLSELDLELLAANGDDVSVFLADEPLDACWSINVFKVCVKSVSAEKIVVVAYLAGSRILTATLTAEKPCVKVKKSAGGDAARINAEICANFSKKEIRTKGRVCASFVCVKFNQKILSW
ncbi:hypothetical protein [Alkalisalibacterium limincola]|uniref:Uncharacterized protein n=1 Tax=Alkalisalibacterium limincola TaxID=2699169 RepID=A0A5C8KUC5_9GAMM|nr:hypothetical protein [Alkalisalibacterium limincola]TXK65106.1 hypothetical protein FU658_04850 [Alkalisalibacterium limincola]